MAPRAPPTAPPTPRTRTQLARLPLPSLLALTTQWLSHPATYPTALEATKEETMELYATLTKPALSARILADYTAWTAKATAEVETEYIITHADKQKWTSHLLTPLTNTSTTSQNPPIFNPCTFSTVLTAATKSVYTSTHIHPTAHPSLPVLLVRVQLDKKVLFLGVPRGGEHVFLSGAKKAEEEVVLRGVCDAVARRGEVYALRPGRFVGRGLAEMCHHRGAAAGAGGMVGGWGWYLDDSSSPLAGVEVATKKRSRDDEVEARFGGVCLGDGKGVGSVQVEVQSLWRGWRPKVGVRLEGRHVFAGVKELVRREGGERRLAEWLTGGEGVTSMIVRDGVVKRRKGEGRFSRV